MKETIENNWIDACKNCPKLDNHIHYDGKMEVIEKDKAGKCVRRFCPRCNDNGCPACDGTKGSKYNPEPY